MTKGTDNKGASTAITPEEANEAMVCTMDYHIKLHTIVRKKLGYARTAAQECITETQSAEALKRYQELEAHLVRLDGILDSVSPMVEEMEHIDETLNFMPEKIHKRYTTLVMMDKELMALIDEIASDSYREAYERARALTEKAQRGLNPMSGLPQTEYDAPKMQNSPTVQASEEIRTFRKKTNAGYVILPNGERVRIIE